MSISILTLVYKTKVFAFGFDMTDKHKLLPQRTGKNKKKKNMHKLSGNVFQEDQLYVTETSPFTIQRNSEIVTVEIRRRIEGGAV